MSLVLKRSITLGGHKTSVTLEDEFWDALRMIAYDDKTTVASLVGQINHGRNKSNLSSAIRVYVLRRFLMMGDRQKERPNPSINAAA
jgi:predicted DNA-binding ribbon-helix-helix protein